MAVKKNRNKERMRDYKDRDVAEYKGINVGLARALEAQEWRFASTMPQWPHEYALQKKWKTEEGGMTFEETLAAMKEWCVESKRWHNLKTRYTEVNGYQYWINDGTLINRNYIKYQTEYERDALEDDAWFDENGAWAQEHYDLVEDTRGKRILDVGCGSGGFVDFRRRHITAHKYQGIDISGAALALAKAKHRDFKDQFMRCALEDFVPTGGLFDVVIAMYGVMSYVREDYVQKMYDLLNRGGVAVLTWYAKPDVSPVPEEVVSEPLQDARLADDEDFKVLVARS